MENWKALDLRINTTQQQLKHQYVIIIILIKNLKQSTVQAPKEKFDYPSQTLDSLKEKSLFSTEAYEKFLLSNNNNLKQFEMFTPERKTLKAFTYVWTLRWTKMKAVLDLPLKAHEPFLFEALQAG